MGGLCVDGACPCGLAGRQPGRDATIGGTGKARSDRKGLAAVSWPLTIELTDPIARGTAEIA